MYARFKHSLLRAPSTLAREFKDDFPSKTFNLVGFLSGYDKICSQLMEKRCTNAGPFSRIINFCSQKDICSTHLGGVQFLTESWNKLVGFCFRIKVNLPHFLNFSFNRFPPLCLSKRRWQVDLFSYRSLLNWIIPFVSRGLQQLGYKFGRNVFAACFIRSHKCQENRRFSAVNERI